MAAVQLSFLLFALISNSHAEEHQIIEENDSFTFYFTEEANFCLISRFVDEEKLVLWNTSDLWTKNSTVPEDLKQRLSFVNETDFFSLNIHNLIHSDSGQYQEECWTEGKATYERNIRITVCSKRYESKDISVTPGGEVDIPCEGASDNLDILWIKSEYRYDASKGEFWDSTTLVMDNVKNTSVLHVSNFRTSDFTEYACLVMNQHQCVSGHSVELYPLEEIIYHSVEESAELQCPFTDFSDEQPPLWKNPYSKTRFLTDVVRNYSLSFPSLTLNHSGWYYCKTSESKQRFFLVVCPTFAPPVVELFSEGDEVTLRCRDVGEGMWHLWFIKSIQTGDRTVDVFPGESKLNLRGVTIHQNASLVISNASLAHSGEYWCAVSQRSDYQCVSTTKTLVVFREPFGIHSTFYKGRWSLLSGLLVVLCAVVVAVTWRTRTRREEET